MIAAPDFAPGLWDVPLDAYHADRTCVSHSALEVFLASVPLYHAQYVAGTIDRDPPTAAMVLGSAVDFYLLEPARFRDLVAVGEEGLTRRQKAWAEFEAQAGGKLCISAEEYDRVRLVADGVCQNPLAVQLLEAPGRNQCSCRWECPETGVRLKCRFDRILDCGIGLDLKTASDPSPEGWARSAANFGYHRQAAIYRGGREYALGLAGEFLHVVVGTSPPYECVVCELDGDAIDLGSRQCAAALARLRRCRERQRWESAWCGRVQPVSLPRWAFST